MLGLAVLNNDAKQKDSDTPIRFALNTRIAQPCPGHRVLAPLHMYITSATA